MRPPQSDIRSLPLSPPREKNKSSNDKAGDGDRKTNIQVCVRVRPILTSDAPAARRTPPTPSRIPTPPSRGKGGGSRKKKLGESSLVQSRVAHYARLTEASQHRRDDDDDGNGSTASSATSATSASTLIPAWEVTCSKAPLSSPDLDHEPLLDDTIYQSPATNPDPARKSSYSFDRVFGPTMATLSMYTESIRDVVTASMEGYHGSVFAYGQTSTGKTHTMTGTPADPGIVPLAVRDCFRYIKRNEASSDREYLLRVSYMEIYNESINDLLAETAPLPGPRSTFSAASSSGAGAGGSSAIRIFESKTEGVVVRGLREEVVTSPEDVFALLATGEARRRTGSTALNRASSRSHSIFRLVVESRARRGGGGDGDSASDGGTVGGPVRVSSLSLVDLAGSESVKATGSTGARQKEGQYINKSLLTLGHVIHKLSEISARTERGGSGLDPQALSKHIPYRDSKLTRLLQPSLSGNAQICMCVCVSPLTRNLEESHNSLKFATRAKKIKQSASINEVLDDRTLLQNYREEIEALKTQLREAKEAQLALQREKEAVSASTPTIPVAAGDDEDIGALVEAIQNLEKLILKKSSVAKSTTGGAQRRRENGTGGGNGSFFSSGGFEALLSEDDDDDEELITAPSEDLDKPVAAAENDVEGKNDKENARENGVSNDGEARTLAGAQGGEEEDGLIEELHRIQGLLGSVLKKKGGSGASPARTDVLSSIGEGSCAATPSKPLPIGSSALQTPARDDEVELLRSQLKEQEVATSLRKADSSFLQSQLQAKDNLLKEVSKILDAVEKRQVELELENTRTKEDLSRTSLLLESREAEIEYLKSQLAGQNDEVFSDLVG